MPSIPTPSTCPAALLLADDGPQARTMLSAIKNSSYFDFVRQVRTETEGRELLARGDVQFVINIPQHFSAMFLRGDRPAILVEADATDPAATGNALGALPLFLTAPCETISKDRSPILPPPTAPPTCASTPFTIPEASRSTTLFPACSESCSP